METAESGFGPQVQAGIAMGITLIFGGLLAFGSPEYTERVTDIILEEPGEAFGNGLVGIICLIGLIVVLVLSGIWIILLSPLMFVLRPAFAVIAVFGALAVGRLVGEMWLSALAVAVVVSGAIPLVPVLGNVLGVILFSFSLGAVILDGKREDNGSDQSEAGTDAHPAKWW